MLDDKTVVAALNECWYPGQTEQERRSLAKFFDFECVLAVLVGDGADRQVIEDELTSWLFDHGGQIEMQAAREPPLIPQPAWRRIAINWDDWRDLLKEHGPGSNAPA